MFSSLRLKLTLINVLVVTLVISVFMGGVYLLMNRSIHIQSEQLMSLIAADAGSPSQKLQSKRDRNIIKYFYVKTTPDGRIYETSENLTVTSTEIVALTRLVLASPVQTGKVDLHNHRDDYRFLKAPLAKANGLTIVFLDTESEDEVIEHLLGSFTAAGLGCAALALIGSFYLANRALIPIKKSWQRQENFVADASHELRTPLSVIQANLDIVIDNPEESVHSQYKWLENIQAESIRMNKLVENLLFLARADSKEELLDKKDFPLDHVLKEAVKPFEPLASLKNIQFEVLLNSKVNFYGDENRIKQLVVILIDNAFKYTPEGGKVVLQTKSSEHRIEISISDTGIGMEKEHLEKIFERFYRVDKARSRQSGSTGLGLTIAEWIAKEHNGSIGVVSTLRKGTTFTVVLPN